MARMAALRAERSATNPHSGRLGLEMARTTGIGTAGFEYASDLIGGEW